MTKPGHLSYSYTLKNGGLPQPINERLRLRLLVSDALKLRYGPGSSKDRIEKGLEREALETSTRNK